MSAQDALTALLEAQNQTDTGTETTATKDANIIYEHQQYYYHPAPQGHFFTSSGHHLGSSSFVTDQTGKV